MKRMTVHTNRPYEVLIGNGLIRQAGEYLRELTSAQRAVIISEDHVAPLYADTVKRSLESAGFTAELFVFPHGENAKNMDTVMQIYAFLMEHNVTRSDMLVALGGGVVGDTVGFAASTYLRGVDFINIPTTFLSQIDSSVGGKTGVNTSFGKNLVGTFCQPRLVLCDIDTLSTLTDDVFADGTAEALKYGLIRDKALFALLSAGDFGGQLADVIYRCVDIKREIVEHDEFDKGERFLLNFGHTLGHAIEKQYNYETYSHGKAVGIGMYQITKAAERAGLTPKGTAEQIKAALRNCSLPDAIDMPVELVAQHCLHDKKRKGQTLNLVLLKEIGNAMIHTIDVAAFTDFLRA